MKKYIVTGILFVLFIVASIVTANEKSFLKFSKGEPLESFDENIEWRFVHGEFVKPSEAEAFYNKGEVVSLPHRFVDHYDDQNQYGTYLAKLTIPNTYTEEKLGVYIPFEYGSYKLYFDRALVAKNGKIAKEKSEQVPQMKPIIGQYQVESREIYITMHLSNFYSNRGGFNLPIEVGEPSEILSRYNTSIVSSYFVNGIIFIVGLFSLLLSMFNQRNKEEMLFALFCIVVAIRSVYARPFTYTVTILDIPWLTAVKIESVCTLLMVLIGLIYCYNKFTPRFPKWLLYGAYSLLAIQICLVIVTEPPFFQATFPYVFVVQLLFIVYMLTEVFRRKDLRTPEYAMHLFSISIIVLGAIHDLIVVMLGYNAPMLVQFTVLVYVLLMMYTMSHHYAQKLVETKKLNREIMQMNETLDKKIKERTLELEEANKRLNVLATQDALTGIANRYFFDSQLKSYFEEAMMLKKNLSLLLFDLDSFKKYNDYYGHVYGDKLLQQVVETVKKVLPPDVVFARYGGEEFAIIAPYMDSEEVKMLGQQVVEAVARERFEHVGQDCRIATISVGGYTMSPNDEEQFQSTKQLIKAADEQLYLAKRLGRNRFVMSEQQYV